MAVTHNVMACMVLLSSAVVASASPPGPEPSHNKCLLAEDHDQDWLAKIKAAWNNGTSRSEVVLPRGPYQVKTGTIQKIPGLTKGGPYAGVVVYAVPKTSGEKFPFISFAHGTTAGGSKTLVDYTTDLELVASYGFVIVAAESCPLIECFSGYCADQQQTIRACAQDTSLHPALASADFSTVGVYGHSMGAMATVGSLGGSTSCKYDASLNIKAAVSQHPCWDINMNAAPVKLPIMFTAGSVDSICEDGCAARFFNQIQHSPSKIMFDVKGANHFEPTDIGSNSEVPAVAYFLSCWLRNENCDRVYGSSGKAICNQIAFGSSLHECTVVGTKAEEVTSAGPQSCIPDGDMCYYGVRAPSTCAQCCHGYGGDCGPGGAGGGTICTCGASVEEQRLSAADAPSPPTPEVIV